MIWLTREPNETSEARTKALRKQKESVAESKAIHMAPHNVNSREGTRKRKGIMNMRSSIPIPREATSVATMMGLLPVLNSFSTQSRSFCCLSPWMAVVDRQQKNLDDKAMTYTTLASHPDGET